MKIDLGIKPYLFPMPVLIIGTYCEDGTPDAMNAAWGTVCDFDKVALFLSEGHKTFANINKRRAFTVAVGNVQNLIACDYVGLVSANKDSDKMKKSGFKTVKSTKVDAPIIVDLPLTLECVLDRIDVQSGCVYGKIVNVAADEIVMTEGTVDLNKLNPISYDPASRCYYSMGEKVGVAFHDGAKLVK